MSKIALYNILFDDNSVFVGGETYRDSKWSAIPREKKIKRMFYTLPDGNSLVLSGYDKYFHMIEATQDITGRLAGQNVLQYAYMFCKAKDEVVIFKISLNNKNGNIGDISRNAVQFDSSVIQDLNKDGWRG